MSPARSDAGGGRSARSGGSGRPAPGAGQLSFDALAGPGEPAGDTPAEPPGESAGTPRRRARTRPAGEGTAAPTGPTVVYTDGACLGNPGPGGWAWAVDGGAWASGAATRTTNQRMEITAAAEAVAANPGPLVVRSDSTYVVNCFRDRWWEGWLRRDWRNANRQPVANRDLWEPFIDEVRRRGDVTFEWVKGHGGDPMNDLVDRLAVGAAEQQAGGSGTGSPDPSYLGAADRPVARRGPRPGGSGRGGSGRGGSGRSGGGRGGGGGRAW